MPFRRRLCWFRGGGTGAVNRRATVKSYVERFVQELSLLERTLLGRLRVGAVHLRGGIPDLLSRDDLVDLLDTLPHVVRLSLCAEVSTELDPAVLTCEWVVAARHHGLTRAGLGVQDLWKDARAAVTVARTSASWAS